MARFSDVVREADVSLIPSDGHTARCVVAVTIGDGTCLRVSARGRHVSDAINRAARRISDALRRHTDIALSS